MKIYKELFDYFSIAAINFKAIDFNAQAMELIKFLVANAKEADADIKRDVIPQIINDACEHAQAIEFLKFLINIAKEEGISTKELITHYAIEYACNNPQAVEVVKFLITTAKEAGVDMNELITNSVIKGIGVGGKSPAEAVKFLITTAKEAGGDISELIDDCLLYYSGDNPEAVEIIKFFIATAKDVGKNIISQNTIEHACFSPQAIEILELQINAGIEAGEEIRDLLTREVIRSACLSQVCSYGHGRVITDADLSSHEPAKLVKFLLNKGADASVLFSQIAESDITNFSLDKIIKTILNYITNDINEFDYINYKNSGTLQSDTKGLNLYELAILYGNKELAEKLCDQLPLNNLHLQDLQVFDAGIIGETPYYLLRKNAGKFKVADKDDDKFYDKNPQYKIPGSILTAYMNETTIPGKKIEAGHLNLNTVKPITGLANEFYIDEFIKGLYQSINKLRDIVEVAESLNEAYEEKQLDDALSEYQEASLTGESTTDMNGID